MNIVALSVDLTRLFAAWGENSFRTATQRERWPQPKIAQHLLSNDTGNADEPRNANTPKLNCLVLLEADGWSDQPVGSLKPDAAARFWSWDYDHLFPPADDMARLGLFLHLDLYHTLALVLKALWENFFAHKMLWKHPTIGHPGWGRLDKILNSAPDANRLKNNFKPDTTDLFALLAREARGETDTRPARLCWPSPQSGPQDGQTRDLGDDLKQFDTLVQEMIAADLHLLGNDSPELCAFAQRACEDIRILQVATQEKEEAFWIAKCAWLETREQLGEMHLVLEKVKLENADMRERWWKLFGKEYRELEEECIRLYSLRLGNEVKQSCPMITREELEAAVSAFNEERRRNLERLACEGSARWDPPESRGDSIDYVSGQEREEKRRECQAVKRELLFLLYPQHLRQHPAYGQFTEGQKEFFAGLWNRLTAITSWQAGCAAAPRGREASLLYELQDIRAAAKATFKIAGLSTDWRLVPQGKALDQRMEWFRQEMERLDRDIANVRLEVKILLDDPDSRERKPAVDCPVEIQEEIRKRMTQQTVAYGQEADQLQKQLDELFGDGAPGDEGDQKDGGGAPPADEPIPDHNCADHRVSDGGGLDPRYPDKTWVTTYRCSLCRRFLGEEREVID